MPIEIVIPFCLGVAVAFIYTIIKLMVNYLRHAIFIFMISLSGLVLLAGIIESASTEIMISAGAVFILSIVAILDPLKGPKIEVENYSRFSAFFSQYSAAVVFSVIFSIAFVGLFIEAFIIPVEIIPLAGDRHNAYIYHGSFLIFIYSILLLSVRKFDREIPEIQVKEL